MNPEQLVDEECEYVNLIEAAPQEEFDKNCFLTFLKLFLLILLLLMSLKPDVKLPPKSTKKSLPAYPDAPKLELKKPPKRLACASTKPRDTSTMEVPFKMSVGKECEKIKFFEKHKTKRKALHDIRLSKTLSNSSKGVDLHVATMKSARGRNYSFGGSCSEG